MAALVAYGLEHDAQEGFTRARLAEGYPLERVYPLDEEMQAAYRVWRGAVPFAQTAPSWYNKESVPLLERTPRRSAMRIVTPTEIEHVAWQGSLQPLGEAYRHGGALPRVALGEPEEWSPPFFFPPTHSVGGTEGGQWTPPAGDRRYTLVRLACTLYPPTEARTRYHSATLHAYLRPRRPPGRAWAHDLYPQRLSEESRTTYSVGLGPDLKFAEAFELSLLELGAEVEVRKAFPVIEGFGLGESHAYWAFQPHAAHPLQGCQSVYLVLSAPQAAGGVRLALELTAELETRYGPLRAGLPEAARAHVSRVVGKTS